MRSVLAVAALAISGGANAFYLPGAAPRSYHEGETVDLFVNALTPMLSGNVDSKLVCGS